MSDDTAIPWNDLSQAEKQDFADLCSRFVMLESVEDAERYYGDKQKLIEDANK